MEKIESPIKDNVAETLYIPLYMRAMETAQPNGIISDPKACELIEKIDYDFSRFRSGSKSAMGVAIRVRHFDQKVASFIKANPNPIVVTIGCGLDTRYYRITDKTNAIFYELDLPEVVGLRNQLLPELADDITIGASMLETGWMDMLSEKHPQGNFIFVIEGVFMYFGTDRVRKVLVDISERFSGASIHFDVVSKWMSRNSHHHDTVKYTKASFRFGCDDDREFEGWSPRLKYVSTQLFSDVKEWRRLFLQGLLMKLVPRFKYAGRMLEYRIQ